MTEVTQTSAAPGEPPAFLAIKSISEAKNVRTNYDQDALADLTDSVKAKGVLTPILVRPSDPDGYELVCGHRRLRAAIAAGLTEVPVYVKVLSDAEVLEAQLIENLQRAGLSVLDEAEGYQKLMAKPHKLTAAAIGLNTGKSEKYVYDRIKLVQLIPELKDLLRAGRITPGHAILLARLGPKQQEEALNPDTRGGGLWRPEDGLFDDPKDRGKLGGYVAVSVRELDSWIAENIRFDAKAVDPMLFPDTAATLAAATEKEEKIVPITHEHFIPEGAREGRTWGPQSWKRADGKEKSKTCDHGVTGIIVVGEGRGDSFKVCIAKEKCKTHWGQWQKERAAVAKQSSKAGGAAKPAGKPQWQIDQERAKAKAAAWDKVIPAVMTAFADAVKKAPTKATGLLAKLILDRIYPRVGMKQAAELIPLGSTAEDFVRHLALRLLAEEICESYNAAVKVPSLAKTFNIDLPTILKAAAPKPVTPAPAKPAAKAPAKKPAPKSGSGQKSASIKKGATAKKRAAKK